jgi:single-strand DNA-binding protein
MSESEINRVVLSGRLACDPEVRELSNGTPVCFLCLACVTGRRVVGGPRGAPPGYLDVIVLGSKARRVARYLFQGRGVVVQGSLESACWEAGEGPEREEVCVFAERVCFMGYPPRGARALARRIALADP